MTVGERIGVLIEQEGIRKVAFADKLKINQSYVSQLIGGRRAPSDRLLDDISEKFGVSRHWLETGEGEMYTKSASQTLDAIAARYNGSPTFRAMLDVYSRLSRAEQDAVEHYIFQLAEAIAAGQNPEQVAPSTWRATMEESERHNRESRQDSAQAE